MISDLQVDFDIGIEYIIRKVLYKLILFPSVKKIHSLKVDKKVGKQELWFLCIILPLNKIYISFKFQGNIQCWPRETRIFRGVAANSVAVFREEFRREQVILAA